MEINGTKVTDENYEEVRRGVTRAAMDTYPVNLKRWLAEFETARDADDWTRAAECMGQVSSLARNIAYGAVNMAKFEGKTWDEIGDDLNITKQAAQQRFGKSFRAKAW